MPDIAALRAEIAACTVCAAHLPQGPRPIVRIGKGARLMIVGQAPGSKVHASGVPWNDDSGDRLRDWLGIERSAFDDPEVVALAPMGFCYPGAVKGGGDLPPRPECAPLWHERILAELTEIRLIVLVGLYAQARYLGTARRPTLTETVRYAPHYLPRHFPLPHPSWRSIGWTKRNPWFATETLPALRTAVQAVRN